MDLILLTSEVTSILTLFWATSLNELMTELKGEFPKDVKVVCISSVSQQGLTELKDEIWKLIHYELD